MIKKKDFDFFEALENMTKNILKEHRKWCNKYPTLQKIAKEETKKEDK